MLTLQSIPQSDYDATRSRSIANLIKIRNKMNTNDLKAINIAKSHYNGTKTDRLYVSIWGGEHIHYGIYQHPEQSIHEASICTVETIANTLENLDRNSRVIDLGAGYGGGSQIFS